AEVRGDGGGRAARHPAALALGDARRPAGQRQPQPHHRQPGHRPDQRVGSPPRLPLSGSQGGPQMTSSLVRLVSVALACALAAPASAELLARKDLSLATALTIATTAAEACKAQGQRVSVTVVGRTGEVIVQLRGDNASPHTMENSFRKAYTARTFRVPSGEIVKRLKDNPQLGA